MEQPISLTKIKITLDEDSIKEKSLLDQVTETFNTLKTILEKIHNNSNLFRKQREKMFISKFNTEYKGMNRITCNTF